MAHIVAVAGNIERLASFAEPRATTGVEVRDGLMRRSRAAPISFGRVRWAERLGQLYLMPAFPRGGMLGNHLVFSWREGERRHALSLHAWEPLTESVERLRRLSPVRRLTMPRGRATVRATIAAPYPRKHAFDVFLVVPARAADIGLRIESSTGQQLRILDSTRSRDCRTRPPLRLCLLRFPRLEAVRGGIWTVVATKRSLPPARVRVDVVFR